MAFGQHGVLPGWREQSAWMSGISTRTVGVTAAKAHSDERVHPSEARPAPVASFWNNCFPSLTSRGRLFVFAQAQAVERRTSAGRRGRTDLQVG